MSDNNFNKNQMSQSKPLVIKILKFCWEIQGFYKVKTKGNK